MSTPEFFRRVATGAGSRLPAPLEQINIMQSRIIDKLIIRSKDNYQLRIIVADSSVSSGLRYAFR